MFQVIYENRLVWNDRDSRTQEWLANITCVQYLEEKHIKLSESASINMLQVRVTKKIFVQKFDQKLDLWAKLSNKICSWVKKTFEADIPFLSENTIRFLTKILIVDQNFNFWEKLWFLSKISIVDQNFNFWEKLWFLSINFYFSEISDFCAKFRLLTKISIFERNCDFWAKFRLLTKISIFERNCDFWPRISIFPKFLIFAQKYSNVFSQNFNFKILPKYLFPTEISILTKVTVIDQNFDLCL